MANTATVLGKLPVSFKGTDNSGLVTQILVSIDTPAADLTVFTPSSNKRFAVVGCQYVEGTAHNLTIKSGSSTLNTYEFTSNSGFGERLGPPIWAGLNAGEAFVVQSSANITSMLVYVTEFNLFVI